MRIIMATFGSFGDISPFIWMGKILKKNGNEIVFIANPNFEKYIINEGFDYHPAGTLDDYKAATAPFVSTGNRFKDQGEKIQASRRLFNYMFLKPARETYEIISEFKTSDTVILHHFYAYGARLAAQKHGIKNVNINLAPYWLKTFKKKESLPALIENKMIRAANSFIDRQLFNKPFNSFRNEIGMESIQKSSIEWMFDGVNLCLFPDWLLDFKLLDSLAIDFVGFPENNPEGEFLPDYLENFLKANEKPVLFTPGTAFENNKSFFSEAVKALENAGRPGIFLTKHKEALPEKLPDSIIHMEFVPLDLLLDKCCAIIHHGGIGTSCQALKAGIPQIICYRMGEQMENARVLKAMGVCSGLSFARVDSKLFLENFNKLINNDDVLMKCEEISKKLKNQSSEEKLMSYLSKVTSDSCCLKT